MLDLIEKAEAAVEALIDIMGRPPSSPSIS
jgi:hypothetical protein